MVSFLGRDNRSIGGQREVNTWVRHQVGLLIAGKKTSLNVSDSLIHSRASKTSFYQLFYSIPKTTFIPHIRFIMVRSVIDNRMEHIFLKL